MQQFLYNTLYHELGYRGEVFIGLTDEGHEDKWIWVDGGYLIYLLIILLLLRYYGAAVSVQHALP